MTLKFLDLKILDMVSNPVWVGHTSHTDLPFDMYQIGFNTVPNC